MPSFKQHIYATRKQRADERITLISPKHQSITPLNTTTATARTLKMKGNATQVKVHFKGQDDDFLIFVDDLETYKKWQEDKSVPLAHFVSAFKIFVTHK